MQRRRRCGRLDGAMHAHQEGERNMSNDQGVTRRWFLTGTAAVGMAAALGPRALGDDPGGQTTLSPGEREAPTVAGGAALRWLEGQRRSPFMGLTFGVSVAERPREARRRLRDVDQRGQRHRFAELATGVLARRFDQVVGARHRADCRAGRWIHSQPRRAGDDGCQRCADSACRGFDHNRHRRAAL